MICKNCGSNVTSCDALYCEHCGDYCQSCATDMGMCGCFGEFKFYS